MKVEKISQARTALTKLNRIWKSPTYNSLAKSILLYVCVAWKLNEEDARKLDILKFTCMKGILKISWSIGISNDDAMKKTESKRISAEIKMVRSRVT